MHSYASRRKRGKFKAVGCLDSQLNSFVHFIIILQDFLSNQCCLSGVNYVYEESVYFRINYNCIEYSVWVMNLCLNNVCSGGNSMD